jgi:hypothetical protein
VAELRDIRFAYQRKKFPKLHDRGELDVILGGRGIGIEAELLAARDDKVGRAVVGEGVSSTRSPVHDACMRCVCVYALGMGAGAPFPGGQRALHLLQDRH